MDGNPDVHAKTIRETLARQQRVIVNAYFKDCQTLAQRHVAERKPHEWSPRAVEAN